MRHVTNGLLLAGVIGALLTLSACASSTELPPQPKSPAMEKYPTQYDLALAREACLEELGWDVTVYPDGSFLTETRPEQQELFDRDDAACLESLGVNADRDLTREELDWLYAYYLQAAECLRDAGFEIAAAPTLQTFVDTYKTSGTWLPWSEVPPSEFPTAKDECPPPPPIY